MREHFSCNVAVPKHGVRDMVSALIDGLAPALLVEAHQ